MKQSVGRKGYKMNYQIRPGVVLTEVCGEFLLLATLDASQYCPYVYQINETAAFFWHLLEQGLAEDQMVEKIAAEYDVPEKEAHRDLRQFMNALMAQGYLLSEETRS